MATIVEGEIDPAFIGLTDEELTNDNFILDPNNNVNSFALLSPVDYEDGDHLPSVWKVFSQKPLEANEFDQIFKSKKEVKVCDWLAKIGTKIFDFLTKYLKQTWKKCKYPAS